jgi:hypothetical protein
MCMVGLNRRDPSFWPRGTLYPQTLVTTTEESDIRKRKRQCNMASLRIIFVLFVYFWSSSVVYIPTLNKTCNHNRNTEKKITPWSESASELYRPSYRRLSAKYCQLLRTEDSTWSAWRIPTAVFSVFYTGAVTFLSSSSSVVLTRLSRPHSRPTTFFLVVPGIEPGPPNL